MAAGEPHLEDVHLAVMVAVRVVLAERALEVALLVLVLAALGLLGPRTSLRLVTPGPRRIVLGHIPRLRPELGVLGGHRCVQSGLEAHAALIKG